MKGGAAIVAAIVAAAAVSLTMATSTAQSADAIDEFILSEQQRQQVPGVAVAVVHKGQIIKTQGYGLANLEHAVPVTDETIFQSGSVGKQFTSALVMLLVEEGRLALDDPLTKYHPDGPASWRQITIRHLLTHTSGIPDYTDGKIDLRKDYTEDDLARLAFEMPLDFPPGREWKYSNTGYVLLGAIVRKASGRFYGDLLPERVFVPLGMSTARIISEKELVPHRAAGYQLEDGAPKNQDWVSPSLNTTADGSLYLSLRDLIAWDRGLRDGRILKAESWAQVFTPVTLTSGRRYPYGFGWSVDRRFGQEVRQHSGSWQGFKSYIARYLGDDLTIIVLANLAQADPGLFARGIARLINPKLGETQPFVISGAMLADGSGAPLRAASVRVQGDTITDVGAVQPRDSDHVIDATGLVLAPGFIDTHNHSTEGINDDPGAESQVSQGITTLLLGQDGDSPWPIADYLARRRASPSAPNIALLVGHATVRRRVMGDDFRRPSRPAEVKRMAALVEQAMREGAVGLSSGLEYEVGSYADLDELVALARAATRHGGFYISHIRDEADHTLDAIREAIAIGERARIPVQVTHIKLGTVAVWGKAGEVVALVEAARKRGVDVTADAYPYLAWQADLKVLVPDKKYDNHASVKEALDDVGGGKNISIVGLPMFPQFVGKTLADVAAMEQVSEVDAYIRIVKDEEAGIIGHTMTEADMRVFYHQPWTMVSSDGGIANDHPRGAGTFPRVLGRFVREEKWLTLPEAIRKMTSLPATQLKLADRGVIKPGMKADLVLFDPDTVLDRSTFDQPRLRAAGIHRVWVNGGSVWLDDHSGGERPGRVLTRDKVVHTSNSGG